MDDAPSRDDATDPVPVGAFATVWLTLFLDLMAFGIILPVLPFYATMHGASPKLVTLLSTSFSLAQFVMAPVLGRISDRHGRRPVMLVSIAGSAASMSILGLAQTLWMVFAARILNGMCNANIATAHAYVADRVPPRDRARYMGMMGAALGLGFVFGPAIGGLLAAPGAPERPFLVASGLAALNWIMAFRFLPESRARQPRPRLTRGGTGRQRLEKTVTQVRTLLWGTRLGWLVLVNFGFYFAFAGMESTFALLMEARLRWGARETGYLFTGIGCVIVVVQGVVVGRLVHRLGEKITLLAGLMTLAVGLSTTGLGTVWWHMALGAAGIAAGNGLVLPSINALVSRVSSQQTQGLSLGLNASGASLARILGPGIAGVLFEVAGAGVPMLAGGGMIVIVIVVAMARLPPRRAED